MTDTAQTWIRDGHRVHVTINNYGPCVCIECPGTEQCESPVPCGACTHEDGRCYAEPCECPRCGGSDLEITGGCNLVVWVEAAGSAEDFHSGPTQSISDDDEIEYCWSDDGPQWRVARGTP